MRIVFIVFLSLVIISCEKTDILPVNQSTEITTPVVLKTTVEVDTLVVNEPSLSPKEVSLSAYHVSPMTHYMVGNQEYILLSSNNNNETPTIQLKKINGNWGFLKKYPEASMGVGRNYEFTKDGIVYADHGWEGEPRPFGKLHYGKFQGDDIKWTTVTVGNGRSFYHAVSTGDINGDGLLDLVGIHMGIRNHDWGDVFHTFTQTTNGSFIENRNLVNHDKGNYNLYNSNGAILVQDLNKDGRPEIIKATYGKITSEKRYSLLIYSFNNSTGQYEVFREPNQLGIYDNPNIGTTSIRADDFDGDGDVDLALAFENQYNGIQIYENKGNLEFIPKDLLKFTAPIQDSPDYNERVGEMEFREFDLIDYDSDGDKDIVLRPFHHGSLFRVSRQKGIILNNLIWRNDGTKFNRLTTEIKVEDLFVDYLKPFIVNGVFKFIGINSEGSMGGRIIKVIEITPKF